MINVDCGSFYLTPHQLLASPSSQHGIPPDSQNMLRLYGCEIVQQAGILLRLPQVVMATAQVLFHRFFCKRSFKEFDVRSVAASCVWLAMKLEEEMMECSSRQRSRLRDVLNVFQRIGFRREGVRSCLPDSLEYTERRMELLNVERQILVELGFVCSVEHPHKFLLSYLKCLEASAELIQEAWNLANDSLRTVLCVTFPSNVIACGVIYAAARRIGVPLPENPPWWHLFDADFHQIEEVCKILSDLYRQPPCKFVEVRDCEKLASQKVTELDLGQEQDVEIKSEQESGNKISKSIPGRLTAFSGQLIKSCPPNAARGSVLDSIFEGELIPVANKRLAPTKHDASDCRFQALEKVTRESDAIFTNLHPNENSPRKRHDDKFRGSDRYSKRYKDSSRSKGDGENTRRKYREGRRKEHRDQKAWYYSSEGEQRPEKRCSTRTPAEKFVSRQLLQTAAG
eukprot:c29251_g3_i1 orf=118-1482(+)